MDYFLEKVFGCNVSMGFNGVLTRHPIFWERIHFEKSESTNLHKHQKKNKVEVEETSTGTKKNKETFQQLWAHFWVGAGNSVFFFCACAGLVLLVVWCFLFFLVLANVL